MTGLNLEVETAVKATDSISDIVAGMKTTLGAINEQAQSAKQFWQGRGNTSFVKTAQDWDEEGRRLNARLDELEAALKDGYKKYDTQDDSVESTFTQLAGELDGKGLNL